MAPDKEAGANYHELLLDLTKYENEKTAEDFDGKVRRILERNAQLLPEDSTDLPSNGSSKDFKNEPLPIRYRYLRTIVSLLRNMQISNDESFSVNQFRSVRIAIELVTSIGILPNLLAGVGTHVAQLHSGTTHLPQEKLTDFQKYERLSFLVSFLVDLYDNAEFRPAIFSQLGPLLAGLLQLSHAPLRKPELGDTEGEKFKAMRESYEKLKKDQEQFMNRLAKFLRDCPKIASIRELMVILGADGTPKWLGRTARKYLIQSIIEPDGVSSIVSAVCEESLDIGQHWNKLDIISRLIATSHGNNSSEYYQSICRQILDLLESNKMRHSSTIANCCIVALYEYDAEICQKGIVDAMLKPLFEDEGPIKSENEVERCVENLIKCFVTVKANSQRLPCKTIARVALPLFCLYNYSRHSACALKSKIEQLVLQLLREESLRNGLFAAYLGHETSIEFGNFIQSRFGPTGGIEIIGMDNSPRFDDFSDSLFNLTSKDPVLSNELFIYLLKFLSNSSVLGRSRRDSQQNLFNEDAIDRIQGQLGAVKLLSNLANTATVQKAQIWKPEPLFSFMKTMFSEYESQLSMDEDDCEVLYLGLVLIKIILSERTKPSDRRSFEEFAEFLKERQDSTNIPAQLSLLTREVVELIEKPDGSRQKRYQDLSVDLKASAKFEEALRDLGDPLLPVRAHGIMTLTKLIETMDPCTVARRTIVLRLFQENLKHEDSFIYLTTINGLCALATAYPEAVIETLVQEFIDMPQRISTGDITTETRVKLGEILVKTTRALGEMTPVHKNILLNGFLCAIRDSDSLVRASSLSCLAELCKVMGFRLGNALTEVIYCISCVIKSDKAPECRRAAVLASTLLLHGLGKDTLTSLGRDLVDLFRGLKYLRDNDQDPVLRLHAQLALEEFDHVVQEFLFSPAKLEKRIFLLDPS